MTKEAQSSERKTDETQSQSGPQGSHSGLDTMGEFRIGARYTLSVRGDGLVIREANSGREKELSEAALEGLLKDTFFKD